MKDVCLQIITVLLASVSLAGFAGCSDQADTDQGHKTQSVAHRSAGTIKYPTGIDTVAAWCSGRFQIVVRALYDEEHEPDSCILAGVRAWFKQGEMVYVRGEKAFVVLNLNEETFEKYPLEKVPQDLQEQLERSKVITDPAVYSLPAREK